MIGLISDECPWISSKRLFILCKAKHNNFYWHYLFSLLFPYLFNLICDILPNGSELLGFSIFMFFAIIALALPFLGLGNIIWRPGEVPNILFLMNYLSLRNVPFAPVIYDSKKINLPFMLLWSNIFSTKYMILSKAKSSTPTFLDY